MLTISSTTFTFAASSEPWAIRPAPSSSGTPMIGAPDADVSRYKFLTHGLESRVIHKASQQHLTNHLLFSVSVWLNRDRTILADTN